MTKTLLTFAVVALFALPVSAQPGPGIAPASQEKPTVAPAQVSGQASAAPPVLAGPGIGAAPNEARPGAAPAYNESADAKADVAAAVARAREEKKRVLVTLGANWCSWCRALDLTFVRDRKIAPAIAKSYVPVKVDVGRMTKNLDLAASWGADVKNGVPLLVVLDGTGKAVKVQSTETFEEGEGYDPKKILAFLAANARP